MRFGCCARMEDYDLLAEAGYDYIELRGRVVCAMSKEDVAAVERRVRAGPLPCSGFVAYCPPEIVIAGPGYGASPAREYARQCAERAARLGARTVGVGSPMSRTLPEGFDRKTAQGQAAEFFSITCEEFGAYGIDVCVEPLGYCFCNFINTLDEGLALVREVDASNLKIVLDFYNMEQAGEPDADLSAYLADTAAIHMSDDDGDPYKRWFFREEKAPIHRKRIETLLALGYNRTVSVEIDLPVTLFKAKQTLDIMKNGLESQVSPEI